MNSDAPNVQRPGPKRLLLAGLLVLSSATQLPAQHRSVRFQRLSLEQGLSQSSVTAIYQDRRGFLWFGTQEGLNRYDGYQFTVFRHDPSDPQSLPNDWVRAIHEDQDGVLWIATDGGGLAWYRPESETFGRFLHDSERSSSLSSNHVTSIAEDRSGNLWIGTHGGGMNRFLRGTGTFVRMTHDPSDPSSLSDNHIRCLYRDREGVLWVGTDGGGLDRFDPETATFRHYRHHPQRSNSLSDDRVTSISEERSGALWIGTFEGGLNRFDRVAATFTRYRHDPTNPTTLGSNTVRAIYEDRQGGLWIGTENGLNQWLPASESFTRYQHDADNPMSLSSNRVLSIYQDRGGVMWVGTFSGLAKWNSVTARFAHYRHAGTAANQLSSDNVIAFAEDVDGAVWIGTYGAGLDRLDRARGTFRHFTARPDDARGLSDDRVMSLLVDRQGTLWVGTFLGGLNRFHRDSETFTRYQHDPRDPDSLSSNGVTTILEGRQGALWIGTYRGGLNRLDVASGRSSHYRHNPKDAASLSDDNVMAVVQGSAGPLWVATDGGGLNRLDPQTGIFTRYLNEPRNSTSLSSDSINCLHEDRRGTLWIGTRGAGLNRWEAVDRAAGRPLFQRYDKDDGLRSGAVYAILEDDAGALWLSGNRGLSRFDPEGEVFRHYDTTHGLQSEEFTLGAAARLRDGQLLFGGINGFNAFDPQEIRDNLHVPPVVLTTFLKANEPVLLEQPVSDLKAVELGYEDRVVAFEFAALDYTAPEKNRYRYYLQGFDRDWVDAGKLRRATYTNLPPGHYSFRVQGSNNDGVWNEEGLALAVTVLPPPWRTSWAYGVYTIIVLSFLSLYIRAQIMKAQRATELANTNVMLLQEIRQRQAKEEDLRREKEKAQKYLDVVEVMVVAIDPQGRVSLINQKGCRVLGLPEAQILGRDWLECFVPERVREDVRRQLESGEAYEYSEYPVLTGGDQERIIAWHTTFLPSTNGDTAGILSSGTDITQVRELEKQLRHAEKMEAIGTLAGGIAHDFKNILTPILGYTAMTLEEMPKGSFLEENLRQVIKAAERARDLVSRILTFSRREEGRRKPVRLQQVVEEALKLLRASLPATIEISTQLDADTAPVLADPTQLHQVIVNLCTNAYHAMGEKGGVLTVMVRSLEIDEEMRRSNPQLELGPNVELVIRDTGEGMEPAILDRIFDPFFTTKKTGEGTGLGLSMVHGIVKAHSGAITVDSKRGQGTRFSVYLPCCAEEVEREAILSTPAPGGRERILFVDDEEVIAELGRRMLERIGYRVTSFTSSTGALEAFRRGPGEFDLVIADQTMPEMTGVELAQEILRLRSDIPIILASGVAVDPRAGDLGIRCFVRKPFEPGEIAKVAREVLDGKLAG